MAQNNLIITSQYCGHGNDVLWTLRRPETHYFWFLPLYTNWVPIQETYDEQLVQYWEKEYKITREPL